MPIRSRVEDVARSKSCTSSATALFSSAVPLTSSTSGSEKMTRKIVEDAHVWDAYESLLQDIMVRDRVLLKLLQKLSSRDICAVQDYLLRNSLAVVTESGEEEEDEDKVKVASGNFRNDLRNQQHLFLNATGFSSIQYDYCSRCLTYLGDIAAKKQLPYPVKVGWYKLKEIGMIPRENCVSTYMYVLSLSDECIAECFEVASFHDRLFEPNEKTITLRIKTLIARGQALDAEQILASLPDKKGGMTKEEDDYWKRLRTFLPILSYYCNVGDVTSILRIFRQMRQSGGVHLDADTYAMILSSLARCGYFSCGETLDDGGSDDDHNQRQQSEESRASRSSEKCSPDASVVYGPLLFDEICWAMAEDLLELSEHAVNKIWQALGNSFDKKSQPKNTIGANLTSITFPSDTTRRSSGQLLVGRVSIDAETGICRTTGAKLRLFALTDHQRRHVHDTLLDMAASQQREYGDKLVKSYQGNNKVREDRNGTYARDELSKFSKWLEDRSDDPFTAFVDGPNVCFYGHGSIHYSQVKLVVDELERRGERPLVIMPSKYIGRSFWLTSLGKFQALDQRDLDVMNEFIENGKMYAIPSTCLDDYYWMLASVANQTVAQTTMHVPPDDCQGRFPGLRPLLITNDQMRDHRLSLLEPREFRRWTSCHIVKYDIEGYTNHEWEQRQVTFFPADFFSREIQSNAHPTGAGSLVWHFPVAEWPEPDRFCVYIAP